MEARTASGESLTGEALAAYEGLAPVYDDFTEHHDYELWLGNLLPKLEEHGISGNRLLDVACGTGKSFLPMLDRGWEVVACDLTPAMAEIARAKAGNRVPISIVDMRELPVLGEFDLVWCLDDAVNYLLEEEELEEAIRRMGTNLRPGGLLMFDVNTLESYRTFFAEEEVVERNGKRMIWKGRTSPDIGPGGLAESTFEVEWLDGSRPKSEPDVHRERHYPEPVVRAVLERAGLEFLDVWGHHHDAVPHQPLSETDHTKAVYIARRPR